ncbi:MAG: hypothetical protein K1X49_08905 [Saprospiraceae bacterium]|nr:hypothetical protein [Saprospiraceae bacterium]
MSIFTYASYYTAYTKQEDYGTYSCHYTLGHTQPDNTQALKGRRSVKETGSLGSSHYEDYLNMPMSTGYERIAR